MEHKINPKHATSDQIAQAIGANIRKRMKGSPGGIAQFCEDNDIPRSTIYRLIEGGNVSMLIWIKVIRALGMVDVLESLISEEQPSPIQAWKNEQQAFNTARKRAPAVPGRLNDILKKQGKKPGIVDKEIRHDQHD